MTDYEFSGTWNQDFQPSEKLTSWETFRNHREIISQSIKRQSPTFAGTLCVLGPGLCNDLDLPDLLSHFEKISLVDIAAQDIQRGLAQQNIAPHSNLKIIANCDVTGVHDQFLQYKSDPNEARLKDILETVTNFRLDELGTFDCVASTCILSQLLCHATDCVGEDNPQFVQILQAMRMQHIQVMIDMLAPGGVGLLFTDFVSSESLPDLYATNDVKETAKKAISERNFLHGLNPAMIAGAFNQPEIKSQLKRIKLTDPWRWVLPTRVYACIAIIFEKATDS